MGQGKNGIEWGRKVGTMQSASWSEFLFTLIISGSGVTLKYGMAGHGKKKRTHPRRVGRGRWEGQTAVGGR